MALHVPCMCPVAEPTTDGTSDMSTAHEPGCFWYAYVPPAIQHCRTCTCVALESTRQVSVDAAR